MGTRPSATVLCAGARLSQRPLRPAGSSVRVDLIEDTCCSVDHTQVTQKRKPRTRVRRCREVGLVAYRWSIWRTVCEPWRCAAVSHISQQNKQAIEGASWQAVWACVRVDWVLFGYILVLDHSRLCMHCIATGECRKTTETLARIRERCSCGDQDDWPDCAQAG